MKKNLYIFTSNNPDSAGGVEKVSREIGYGFNKTGKYNVNFVFPGKKTITENKNGINYVSIENSVKMPLFTDMFFNIKLIKFFKNLGNKDIVINNNFSPIFYLLFNKKQFKLVHICHGTMYGSSLSVKNWGLGFFKKWLNILYARCYDLLVRAIIKKADLIITLSKYLEKELIQYYKINPNKVAIIYNGCDENNHKLKEHDKDSILNVAFIGSEYGGKGLNILEGVAKKMINENIFFNVIGTDSYKSNSENIKSLGRIKREEVYKNMAESDVIFLPSHYEGQPLVLLEGMSFGCIPVCSIHCHMDMLEGTKFEDFVSIKNCIEDYVSMFRNLLQNDNIDGLRMQSRDIVSKLTWDNQVKKYIDLIDNL